MIKFVGEYKAKLDDKGRLIFPAPFKSLLGATQTKFVIKNDLFEKCLVMYAYEEWEKESENIKSKLNFFSQDDNRLWRSHMSNRALIEPDEKMGRISIPKKLLESIDVVKEVVFFGNDHKIEIWASENYESYSLNSNEFISLAEKLLG